MYGNVTAEGREMNGDTVNGTCARSGWDPGEVSKIHGRNGSQTEMPTMRIVHLASDGCVRWTHQITTQVSIVSLTWYAVVGLELNGAPQQFGATSEWAPQPRISSRSLTQQDLLHPVDQNCLLKEPWFLFRSEYVPHARLPQH